MKDLLLGFIVIGLFSLNGEAQENSFNKKAEFIYGSITTTFNQEVIEYKFKSLEELDQGVEEVIKDFDFDNPEKGKACEMKIEIKVTLTSGKAKILISEIIDTSCDNESLAVAANRLTSMALATR